MGDSTIDSHIRHADDTEKPSPETLSIDETIDEDDFGYRLTAVLGTDAVRALANVAGPGPTLTYQMTGTITQDLEPETLAFLEKADSSPVAFTPLDTLGEGGMGIVHLAAQEVPSRYVAIKTLKNYSPEGAEQIFAEAMLTGSLEHPNIIPVHAIHLGGKRGPEVVMKKVEGISMQEAIDSKAQDEASLQTFLQALIKVCYALEYAHAQGVLHRDIKPENIMLGEFGEVYLMDWGIAIDTRRPTPARHGLVGTPHFMAPEMVTGDPESVDERTDVYLLGATLHYLLAARPRHDESRVMAALVKARLSRPFTYPKHVFPELGDLANRACSKNPDDRPQTAAVFREAIEECLKHWEAVKIVQRVQRNVDALTGADSKSLPLVERVRQYEVATSGLESALVIWPDFEAARQRLLAVREVMLKGYADADQPDLADAIYSKITDEYPEQTDILEMLKNTVEGAAIRKQRISLQVAANDLAPSTSGRRRAALSMVVLVGLICSVMGYLEYHRTEPRSSLMNLFVWLAGCVIFGAIIFKDRKTFMTNDAGRRVLIPLICGPSIVLLMRLGVYLRDLDPIQSMPSEIMVLGFACATMTPAFPNGPKLGVVSLFFATLAFTVKEFAYASFVATCLVCSAGLAWEWIVRGRAFPGMVSDSDQNTGNSSAP